MKDLVYREKVVYALYRACLFDEISQEEFVKVKDIIGRVTPTEPKDAERMKRLERGDYSNRGGLAKDMAFMAVWVVVFTVLRVALDIALQGKVDIARCATDLMWMCLVYVGYWRGYKRGMEDWWVE